MTCVNGKAIDIGNSVIPFGNINQFLNLDQIKPLDQAGLGHEMNSPQYKFLCTNLHNTVALPVQTPVEQKICRRS